MIILYFSGTGNSKYVAEVFSKEMNIQCFSIEENIDFEVLINANDTIAFCYPIYASRVPRIMRDFIAQHKINLKDKKLIIFCTQALFSGDGARALYALFPKSHIEVIYAEHFFMPNNINNLLILPLASSAKNKKLISKTENKIISVCEEIKKGIVKKRGFNIISRALGMPQALFLPVMEKQVNKSVIVRESCNNCQICVSVCPMNNLMFSDNQITHNSNCTACYRCVNKCPQKAITVGYHGKVRKQYQEFI